jgi:RNA polymerase sigma factor (sigma-70 family)
LRPGGGRRQARRQGEGDADEAQLAVPEEAEDLLALDEAPEQLAAKDSAKAELVKLRYFAGLTIEEAAEALGISPATAKRHWAYARAWLYRQVSGGAP